MRQFLIRMAGARRRAEQTHNQMAWGVWMTGQFLGVQGMPPLDQLQVGADTGRRRRQTPEEHLNIMKHMFPPPENFNG